MRTRLLVPGRARSIWLKGREYLVKDEVMQKGWGQKLFIIWLSSWFILDRTDFGMYKELNIVFFSDENYKAQKSKDYS